MTLLTNDLVRSCAIIPCAILAASIPALATAAEPPATVSEQPQLLKLAEGKLQLPVPGNWKSVKPRSRIIQHEFSIPVAEEDETPGRMTIMAASGGLEANIVRWSRQFQTPEGKPLGEDATKVHEQKVSGLVVHQVDLSGNYQDKPRGPFGPTVNRPGYRMLGAIIPTTGEGTWFIKVYGPPATIDAAAKNFEAMIGGLVWESAEEP